MGFLPFLKKDSQKLPNNYTMKVTFFDGAVEEFEMASHQLIGERLEFYTKDDLINWIWMSSVKKIKFDKRFTVSLAERDRLRREELKNEELEKKLKQSK